MKIVNKLISALVAISLCCANLTVFANNEMSDKQMVQEYFAEKNINNDRENSEIIVAYSGEVERENISESVNAKIESKARNIQMNEGTSNFGEFNVELERVISDNVVLLKTNNIEITLEALNDDDNVLYAQPNYRIYTASSESLNDKLWAMENKGQIINGTQGSSEADLNIPAAWEITKGNDDVVIAVLDTGIDISHPALSGNIWTNSSEQMNGIDNDNNGYVDDVNGWDFVNNDASVFDNAAVDEHGTHIAGIIAANGENGVYGVAPNIKIMPLKVMENDSGYTSDVIEAIEYAEKNGAKIVNCSFAGVEYNPALEDAISKSEMLFVTSAGNFGKSTDELVSFPACFDCKNIISVGGTDNTGNIASISTYGDLIDTFAPAMGIYSTLPGNEYGFKDGTSCSAAYISGIAALLYSKYPELRIKQVKEAICSAGQSAEEEIQLMSTNSVMPDAEAVLEFDFTNAKSAMPERINSGENTSERETLYPFSFYDDNGIKFTLNMDGEFAGNLTISAMADGQNAPTVFSADISDTNTLADIQNIENDTEYNFSLTYNQGTTAYNYYGKLKRSYIEEENKYLTESYNIVTNNCETEEVGATVKSVIMPLSDESENNNTMGSANTVNNDDDVYGTISSASDVDWYKVKFSSSGVANFWLGQVPSDCNYQLELYNASGSHIAGSYNATGQQELISFYPVSANIWYYIKIYSASGYSSSQYKFRVKWYPSPDSYESNDSFSSATTLGRNSYKSANINHPEDVDFYKFTLTQRSYVELTLGDIPSGCRYNMEIYNGAGESYFIGGVYTTASSKQYLQILNSGTYYVRVYSYSGAAYSADYYTIDLAVSPVYALSLSGNTSGSVAASEKTCYTFSTSSTMGITIDLSGVSSSDYDLFLYEVLGSAWSEVAIGESSLKTGETVSATLTSGDYVLVVKRYSGSESSYMLSVSKTTTARDAEITVSGFPTTMTIGSQKAVTVTVKNLGTDVWTKSGGYKLGGLSDVASFASMEFLLNSSDKIQYGQSKTFTVNLTAPSVSTATNYTLNFRMKQNSIYFGSTSDSSIIKVLPEFDTITTGNTKTISGVSEKYYKLTVSTAANYVFRTLKYSTKYDTKLYLYDSAMNQIAYNDDIYDADVTQNRYSKIEKYLSAGTYYICVKPYSGSTVQCYLNVDTYTEGNISSSVNVSNKYEGYYKYTVSTAGTYVFSTKKYSTNCDTYLILLDSNGNVIAHNNDSDSSVYAQVETDLSKGTYYIRVSSYKYIANGENAKTYCTLTVGSKATAPSTGDSASISITFPSAGNVIKTYTGNTIKIAGTASNCSGVTVKINGTAISGVKLSGSKYEAYYSPIESGRYTIMVIGNAIFGSNPSASRTVTIAVNDDDDNFTSPTAINSGTERVAAIDFSGDVDCFSFTPKETGSYKIYSSGSVNLKGILYENDKVTSIGTSYNAPESVNFKLARTLEKNKTYYIRVDAENSGTGKYTINIEKIDEPDDTYFKEQWGIFNKGTISTSGGTISTKIGYDINVLPVWEYTKGAGITVGVLDSGVEYTHDDLQNNLILPGYNTVHGNTDIFPINETISTNPITGYSLNNAASEGHGTHVSGIVSATGSNNTGISGVAPEAMILPVKVTGNGLVGTPDANNNLSDNNTMLDGIQYAVNYGVNIINMSLQHFTYEPNLQRAINNASDVLFIVAAGNDGLDLDTASIADQYPGMYNCDNMITVANMRYDGYLASDSNYGGTTHIAAPGEDILSTYPGNDYRFMSGTSMATPMVSGVAALIWSYYPNLTAIQVKQRIISSNNVSYSDKLSGKVISNGYLNAWYAFSNDSTHPRKLPVRNESGNSLTEKEIITLIKNSTDSSEKTCDIFVKAIDDDECAEIIEDVLEGYNYEIIKQYELIGSYLVRFNSVEEADRAIDILNAREDIEYSSPNYIISIN